MPKLIDLAGQRFGRLSVISRAENDKFTQARWLCRCDCGNETVVLGGSLRSGNTKSCGCLQKEKAKQLASETIKKAVAARTKHGLCRTRLYKIWENMKCRCTNPNHISYKDYGARGISICSEWLDKENGFINFYNWALKNGYSDDLSIDRIDVDGNYEPTNCRWVSMKEQAWNKRNSAVFVWEGKEYPSVRECARQLGINSSTLQYRAKKQREREEE